MATSLPPPVLPQPTIAVRQAWEYKLAQRVGVVGMKTTTMESDLNALGAESWEIIKLDIHTRGSVGVYSGYTAWLKRPVAQ